MSGRPGEDHKAQEPDLPTGPGHRQRAGRLERPDLVRQACGPTEGLPDHQRDDPTSAQRPRIVERVPLGVGGDATDPRQERARPRGPSRAEQDPERPCPCPPPACCNWAAGRHRQYWWKSRRPSRGRTGGSAGTEHVTPGWAARRDGVPAPVSGAGIVTRAPKPTPFLVPRT